MKILLIGHEGQVAWELRRTLACLGNVTALGRATQPSLDLTQPDDIRATLRALQPKLIVNAAAYTAVDKAEEDREAAYCINAIAVAILAEEAKLLGVGLGPPVLREVVMDIASSPVISGACYLSGGSAVAGSLRGMQHTGTSKDLTP
jgi:hypothetical protein